MTEVTAATLATHPFLRGMSPDHLAILAAAGSDVTFPARHRLFEDGGHAGRFWLIQSGCVALDLNVPGQGLVRIETIGMSELLGWSWLFPPFTWAFGAVTVSPVQAFEFDGRAVRASCAADPAFGYELTRRFTAVIANRLQATRIRLTSASPR
jgi:CRP/FNR family transcriptional regulator, cyclic AMP receptor protein